MFIPLINLIYHNLKKNKKKLVHKISCDMQVTVKKLTLIATFNAKKQSKMTT